jgi:uncharacterized repeat protein (TIGR01451 family)
MTRTLRLAVVSAALCVLALAFTSSALAAGDPDHVSFTLEGCRLPAGETLPNGDGKFVCNDADYTTGNLGKNWNELDIVPFRATATSISNVDQTYTVAIALDACDGGTCPPSYTNGVLDAGSGHPGYDVIGSDDKVHNGRPVVNATSDAGCAVTDTGQLSEVPGVGGTGQTIYRLLTITQPANSTCVFDWWGRLALGSHLYPGSSLHANLLNQQLGTSGIGAKDVSIPVKEILPQELSKTMTATQGASYGWTVSKTGTDNVNFNNSCDPDAAHSATVSSTITWTRTAPSGDITVTTEITITNPSHRDIIANVTDTVRSGTTAVTPTGSGETNPTVFAPKTVPAGHSEVLTNVIHVALGTTNLNDHAVATYTDTFDPSLTIPGQTTADASATVDTSNTLNQTATITDAESITGDGLTYSIDSIDNEPAGSSFTAPIGYALHDKTTSSTWQSGTIDPGSSQSTVSGTITFHKTIYLDGAHDIDATAGAKLHDTATLTDSGAPPHTRTASWDTNITASRDCATLTIQKVTVPEENNPETATEFSFTPSESLDGDQTVFALHHGESKTYSDLVPGVEYSAAEAEHNHYRLTDVSCDSDNGSGDTDTRTATATPVAGEHVTCTFENTKVTAGIEIVKTGTPDVVHDGDNVTFTYAVSNPSSNNGSVSDVVVSDDKCADIKGPLSKSGGNNDDLLDPGETWTFSCTTPAKHADEDANHVITNVATASGKDEFGNPVSDQDDDTTKVIHPAIKIEKTGPATAQAGDKIAYVLTVTNPGDTPLTGSSIVITDQQCNGDPVTLLGKGGDGSPDSLDPGDTWTFTCSVQTAVGDQAVENHATVEGKDQLGKAVTSAAVANTVLSQPAQAVLGARVTPGSARLLGATGCQSRAFNARIRGTKMATVTFVLDGKVVKKVRKVAADAKVVAFRVNPTKLRIGVHRLVVTVTFQSGSSTKPKTFRLSFQRCAKKLVTPRFTG